MAKKIRKEHKKSFSQTDNPDSITSRSQGSRKALDKDGKSGGFGGAEIMQMLGLDDEGQSNSSDKSPLKMMDIVMQTWDQDPHFEPSVGQDHVDDGVCDYDEDEEAENDDLDDYDEEDE